MSATAEDRSPGQVLCTSSGTPQAVALTYATGRGHALIGRALYLPEGCAADEEHSELVGIPEEVM
jgi:hypothetical protein